MKASEFDRKFDASEDISGDVDLSKARRPSLAPRRSSHFPAWVVEALDREAGRLGVTRQALVGLWIAERLGKTDRRQGVATSNAAGQKDAALVQPSKAFAERREIEPVAAAAPEFIEGSSPAPRSALRRSVRRRPEPTRCGPSGSVQ